MKIAHTVELDHVKHELRIDGLTFPYYVEPDPQVYVLDGRVGVLQVGIYADNLSVITAEGTQTKVSAPHHIEMAWAAERGKEIVRDGLADVIAWLGSSRAALAPA
jgi:hypothetical protein